MQFVKPQLFEEAIEKLGLKTPIGSDLSSSEWKDVPLALRERAFFSSRVESVRFLDRSQGLIKDFLANHVENLPSGEKALKVGGRAAFVEQARRFAIAEGMGPLDPRDKGTIKDITSQRRLELIFDTQVRQAQDYGYWRQGQDPDVLDAFPAQRFVREREAKEPREWHRQFEGEVRLKSNLEFWRLVNRDFGVPWGPWGWGCGHDVEDVDRDEAESIGLLKPGEPALPALKDFNDQLEASVRDLDSETIGRLAESLGDKVEFDGESVRWKGSLRNESIQSDARRAHEPTDVESRAAGEAAARLYRALRSRNTGAPFDVEVQEQAGAHISSVVAGRKPLYHEQWTADDVAALIPEFRATMGGLVEIQGVGEHLYAYRPDVIRQIIASDPAVYPGKSLLAKIHGATVRGDNGILLGYGARSMDASGLVSVRIVNPDGRTVFAFRSTPNLAEQSGRDRALDFTAFTGRPHDFIVQ